MTLEQLDLALLAGAVVLLVAIAAVRLSVGTGLPSLVLYVGLGLLLGREGLGIEWGGERAHLETAQALGYSALVVILAEGGLTTSWSQLRPTALPAASLATVGVLVSVGVTALVAAPLLPDEGGWRFALLVGAVVAPTDSAAVFSVLRRVPLPPRLAGLLEAESGFNDATAVLLVVTLSTSMATPAGSGWAGLLEIGGLLVYELLAGAAIGLLVGRVGAAGVRRIALPASGLYPIAVMALAVGAYALAGVAHASGFLAVYLAAMVLGNARLPHGPPVRGFAEGLAWLAQIGLFVMLGLLVTPSELGAALLPALGVGAALLLLARPLSVLVALLPFRLAARSFRPSWREQAFLSWAGLRGAVPIVLAIVPVVQGVPGSEGLLPVVFVLVVVLTVVQGPTLPGLATRLAVAAPAEARDVDVESSPLVRLGADLLELRIPPTSRLHGVEVLELRLPPGAAVPLVVRDGRAFVPGPTTPLRHGDDVLVVAPAAVRESTEARLREVSRAGRLARWYDRQDRT
ncbi:MAG: potassium/proton antiporter [Actinomycetota bacterium]|nr:potassium/proton antiporter [Actinomycetota bacterium]MDP9459522.1 potassium/proton antiporter [Actinomycetota bacterium]